jgi:type I restriction enzyme R subunit
MAAKGAVAGVPAVLHGRHEAIVIYNNLPDILANPLNEEERAELALRIDQAMRKHAPADWKGDFDREKMVRNALFPIMGKDRNATLAIFEIIKNQPGYL